MSVSTLLVRVRVAGFALELSDGVPRLLPVEPGAKVPADLIGDLKAARGEIVRYLAVAEVQKRAGERKVWGFSTDHPDTTVLKKDEAPANWDWIAAEGSDRWTWIPRAEAEPQE